MNGFRDSLTIAFLVAAAGALIAACGAESGGDAEDFAAAADRICAETARRDVDARRADPQSQADYLRQLRHNRKEALRELERLSPPAIDAERFDAFLAIRHEAAIGIEEGIEAADRGDVLALNAFRLAARERVLAAQAIAAEIGLEACAGRLPARERAAVGEAIGAALDPARAEQFCTRHTTPAMRSHHFGSVSTCVAAQASRQPTDSVTIEELYGVAGVAANAIVALSRAGEPLGRFEVALVHEGDTWRYDDASPVPVPE